MGDCETCGTPWEEMYGEGWESAAVFQKCPACGFETCEMCRDSGVHDSLCSGSDKASDIDVDDGELK